MNSIGSKLSQIRKELGFSTSKEFFNYLKSKGLDCNYQHYVKIEKNSVIPSSILVHQIAMALEKNKSKELILSYCAQLFPKHDYLFDYAKNDYSGVAEKKVIVQTSVATELSERQIKSLSKRKENYYLFLILTLSRIPIQMNKLENIKFLNLSIKDLLHSCIAVQEGELIRPLSTEYRFPKNESFKKDYEKFDLWDVEFTGDFKFELLLNKMMIRRISPRYLNVINQQIEALTGLVRLSDESDKMYNTEVLHLHIKIQKGDLPG